MTASHVGHAAGVGAEQSAKSGRADSLMDQTLKTVAVRAADSKNDAGAAHHE